MYIIYKWYWQKMSEFEKVRVISEGNVNSCEYSHQEKNTIFFIKEKGQLAVLRE